MRSIPLFIVILIAFTLSLSRHVSIAMYPLSAIIFYFYLPILYASSRMNILHHIKDKEIFHIRFYPMELSMWLVSTSFFAFILSHLISDILFDYRESLYHFTIFLISLGLLGILYCEQDAAHYHFLSKKNAFELQGKFLSFEIFFIMTWLFFINH